MKPLFMISCPIDTYSGYGARSRDLVKALIELDKYDIKIIPQRWGNTPWGFIDDHKEKWGFLTPHLLPAQMKQLPQQPDIWAQLTVPNEFQPVGKFNIGFTAGMETTKVAAPWIQGVNRMDITFVSSEHSKNVFLDTQYQQMNPNTQQPEGMLQVEKPIEVLFEGVDLNTYMPKSSTFDLDHVEENFAYLCVGHWMQGDFGEDRKNISGLLYNFYTTFKNKKKTPALLLKVSGGGNSYIDREMIINKIQQVKNLVKGATTLPSIYLLHGELSDEEMNEMYNHKKVKAMISFTKGEGYGRPLLEFSLTKKPIIAPNWSGHVDFLDPKFVTLINGELKNVHKNTAVKDMILEESQWFNASHNEFSYYLKDMFENYNNYKEKAVRQAYKSKTEFNFEKMSDKLDTYLENCVPELSQQIDLKLPDLKLV